MNARVAVMASTANCLPQATALAKTLGLPLREAATSETLMLVLTPDRLELRAMTHRPPMVLAVDFSAGALGYRRNRLASSNELLRRAVIGRRGPSPVLDLTAGLGRDAFILASLGCQLTLLERSPVIAALLQDGLRRGLNNPLSAEDCQRMQLHLGDAHQWLATRGHQPWPGVIYLDPMYPQRRGQALAGKEMQMLQALLDGDEDADRLLDASLALARQVVVKRPRLAPFLGAREPHRQICGRSTRFDIYLPRP